MIRPSSASTSRVVASPFLRSTPCRLASASMSSGRAAPMPRSIAVTASCSQGTTDCRSKWWRIAYSTASSAFGSGRGFSPCMARRMVSAIRRPSSGVTRPFQ